MGWIVVLLAALLMWALLDSVLPHPPSRTRRRLARLGGAALARLHPATRGDGEPDPFDALRLQSRLGALATEIRAVESSPRVYARVHRLVALHAAYDDLLDEACRMAGVPARPGEQRGEALRWEEERELAERGWSW